MKQSAEILLYKTGLKELEVLPVHPAGSYSAPWRVPKGEPDDGETLESVVRSEALEETGIVAGELTEIEPIDYVKPHKRVHCIAGPLPVEESSRRRQQRHADESGAC